MYVELLILEQIITALTAEIEQLWIISVSYTHLEAKKGLDKARQRVADAINSDPKEIIFTSGGSESDNLAIKGIALKLKGKGNHIRCV